MHHHPCEEMDGESSAAAAAEGGEQELLLVLLLRPLMPAFYDHLSLRFRFLKPWESPEPIDRFLTAHAGSVQALLCSGPKVTVSAETIALLPKLELVVTTGAGVDHIDVAECRSRGIAVTNVGDAFAADAADYAVGLLIDALRKVSAADRFVRRGIWPLKGEYPLGYKLGGKRIGIVGLGNIGFAVAKRLEAFGCIIMYHSRKRKPSVSYSYFANVEALATESDVLVLTCALTKETRHIINRDMLLALGKEGIVINVGRGALINEKELVRCLMQGEIGGAGLDVFENEPNVPQELFSMDNVVLSHHRAVLTPEAFSGLLQIVTDNLEAFFSNKPLLTLVLD